MSHSLQQNGNITNATSQSLGAPVNSFAADSSPSYTPQRKTEPRKFDWEDPYMFDDMSLIIGRVAFEIARPEELDTFNDACRESGKFQRTAEEVARAYYRRGMDGKNRWRTDDMKRAVKLKEMMEKARGVCFENFFRTKKHRRTVQASHARQIV